MLSALRKDRYQRVVASIIAATMAFSYPVSLFAEASAVEDGAALGRELREQLVFPEYDDTTGTARIGNSDINMSEIYPGSAGGDVSAYAGRREDDELNAMGFEARDQLETEQSNTGTAYRILQDTGAVERPDLSNDPVFAVTDAVMDNLDVLKDNFGDCNTEQVIIPTPLEPHIPDEKQCSRLKAMPSCSIKRIIESSEDCTPGVLTSDDPYWTDVDGIIYGYEFPWVKNSVRDVYPRSITTTFTISRVDRIAEAKLSWVKIDDWVSMYVNGHLAYGAPFGGANIDRFEVVTFVDTVIESWSGELGTKLTPAMCWGPYDKNAGWCSEPYYMGASDNGDTPGYWVNAACGGQQPFCKELDINRKEVSPDFDFKQYLVDGENTIEFKHWAVDKGDLGIKIDVKTQCGVDISESFMETPAGCKNNADTGGYYDLEWYCSDEEDGRDIDGLAFYRNTWPGNTLDPLYEGDTEGPLCYEARRRATTVSTIGALETNCATFESDPSCGYIKSQCVEGTDCWLTTETWDCGYTALIASGTLETTYDCEGSLGCMGTDCASPDLVGSDDFARAAADLSAASFLANEADCTGSNCVVFAGEPADCKQAVGGWSDCCEEPRGVSLADYITLVVGVNKLTTAATGFDALGTGWSYAQGAWNATTDYVSSWFTSSADTLTAGTEAAVSETAAEGIMDAFIEEMMKTLAEWTYQAFGEGVTNFVFQSAAEGGGAAVAADGVAAEAGVTINPAIASAMGTLMMAYMIYQVANILVHMYWKCEQHEFELNAKRKLRSCLFVGDYCYGKDLEDICVEKRRVYCCFASPMPRIMQEAARGYLGMTFGTPKYPDCAGLDISVLTDVDWNDPDVQAKLDEWMEILSLSGQIPDLYPIEGRQYVEDPMEAATERGEQLATIEDHLPLTKADVEAYYVEAQTKFDEMVVAYNAAVDVLNAPTGGSTPHITADYNRMDSIYTEVAANIKSLDTSAQTFLENPAQYKDLATNWPPAKTAVDVAVANYAVAGEAAATKNAEYNEACGAFYDSIPQGSYTLAEHRYTMEGLTGEGSVFNHVEEDVERPNTAERTDERLEHLGDLNTVQREREDDRRGLVMPSGE